MSSRVCAGGDRRGPSSSSARRPRSSRRSRAVERAVDAVADQGPLEGIRTGLEALDGRRRARARLVGRRALRSARADAAAGALRLGDARRRPVVGGFTHPLSCRLPGLARSRWSSGCSPTATQRRELAAHVRRATRSATAADLARRAEPYACVDPELRSLVDFDTPGELAAAPRVDATRRLSDGVTSRSSSSSPLATSSTSPSSRVTAIRPSGASAPAVPSARRFALGGRGASSGARATARAARSPRRARVVAAFEGVQHRAEQRRPVVRPAGRSASEPAGSPGRSGSVASSWFTLIPMPQTTAGTVGLEQDPRDLAVVDDHVVRPLHHRASRPSSSASATASPATSESWGSGDRARRPEQDRDEDRRPWLRLPGATRAAAPGRLLLGHRDRALGQDGAPQHVLGRRAARSPEVGRPNRPASNGRPAPR